MYISAVNENTVRFKFIYLKIKDLKKELSTELVAYFTDTSLEKDTS